MTSGKLDRLDIHLIREILQGRATLPLDPDFRKSFRAIAKRMSVDGDTVRSRVRRLEEIGFTESCRIHPNPHLLGINETAIRFDVPS